MPALSLLPVILLASPRVAVSREALTRMAAAAVAYTLALLAVSPVIAAVIHMRGVENNAAYARLAGQEAARVWSEHVNGPLRLIAGPFTLVNTAAFYLPGQPSTFAEFWDYLAPWATPERIARDGMAIICPTVDVQCVKIMQERLGPDRKAEPVTLVRNWLGIDGRPATFLIGIVPPRSAYPVMED
jgi:hypothetical protein